MSALIATITYAVGNVLAALRRARCEILPPRILRDIQAKQGLGGSLATSPPAVGANFEGAVVWNTPLVVTTSPAFHTSIVILSRQERESGGVDIPRTWPPWDLRVCRFARIRGQAAKQYSGGFREHLAQKKLMHGHCRLVCRRHLPEGEGNSHPASNAAGPVSSTRCTVEHQQRCIVRDSPKPRSRMRADDQFVRSSVLMEVVRT